jgi:tetratricopeptide (TPR) repeat protein
VSTRTSRERPITTIDSRLKRAHGLLEREEYAKAWPLASELLNENPDNARALYIGGNVMRQMGHTGVALQLFRRALAIEPKQPNLWMHFGACLHDTHRYDEARDAFKYVHKQLPDDPMPPANIAATYIQQGKPRDAVEWADKALKLEPDHKIASISKSFGCLALGRWADGWERAAHLYGDHLRIRVYNPPEKEEPVWDGSPGKTVVVQADQGLGDMLMFAQCIPQLVKDCKKVVIETDARLVSLFARNFPDCDVYGTLGQKSDVEWPSKYEIDAHIHISWLGKFYRRKDEDFPKKPYLKADPEKAAKWRTWLAQFPRPWVGIAWRGGIQRTNEASRSIALNDLEPILTQGGSLINLAYQDVPLEIARWNLDHREQIRVPDIDNDGDYDETVALISELDHVVTVTTTVAHVCGALGKKAYVLVNQSPQWRYCYGGDHLMWYPDSLTLYRQKPGETSWGPVINRLAQGLQILQLAA